MPCDLKPVAARRPMISNFARGSTHKSFIAVRSLSTWTRHGLTHPLLAYSRHWRRRRPQVRLSCYSARQSLCVGVETLMYRILRTQTFVCVLRRPHQAALHHR